MKVIISDAALDTEWCIVSRYSNNLHATLRLFDLKYQILSGVMTSILI